MENGADVDRGGVAELEREATAGGVLRRRIGEYLACRYPSGEVAPRAFRLMLEEAELVGAGEDGDLEAVRAELAVELAAVWRLGAAPREELAGLAQAYATLARSLAGSPLAARGLRETLGGVVDLLEVFLVPAGHPAGYRRGERLHGLSVFGGEPKRTGRVTADELREVEEDAAWLRNRAGYRDGDEGEAPEVVAAGESEAFLTIDAELYAGELLLATVHHDNGREALDMAGATRVAWAIARAGAHLFRLAGEVRALQADRARDLAVLEQEVYEMESAGGMLSPTFPGLRDPVAVLVERLRGIRAKHAQRMDARVARLEDEVEGLEEQVEHLEEQARTLVKERNTASKDRDTAEAKLQDEAGKLDAALAEVESLRALVASQGARLAVLEVVPAVAGGTAA
jgi:hypothetical protein